MVQALRAVESSRAIESSRAAEQVAGPIEKLDKAYRSTTVSQGSDPAKTEKALAVLSVEFSAASHLLGFDAASTVPAPTNTEATMVGSSIRSPMRVSASTFSELSDTRAAAGLAALFVSLPRQCRKVG